MNVLITGGAGYIGSHTCKKLSAAGYQPVVLDNLSTGHEWAVKWGPLEVCDLRDARQVGEIIERHEPVAVMHFAGSIEAGESVVDPAKYYDNNVGGAIGLLTALKGSPCQQVVFSSTCATYGAPEVQPIDENTAQNPINTYGETKLMVETMLRDHAAAYGTRAIVLRYFNACGADPEGEVGEAHDPESHLIPRALMAVTGGIPHLDLLGTDYPTPDGTAIRDYIHVSDLADGHIAALARLVDGGASGAFNLGTGTGRSVREVIDAVERVTGCPVPVKLSPRRPGDMPELVANADLARRELSFIPKMTVLDDVIKTAWDWHRNRPTQ